MIERISVLIKQNLRAPLSIVKSISDKGLGLMGERSREGVARLGMFISEASKNPLICSLMSGSGVVIFGGLWHSGQVQEISKKLAQSDSLVKSLIASNNKLRDDNRVDAKECEYYKDTSHAFERAYKDSWCLFRAPVENRSKFSPKETKIARDVSAIVRLEKEVSRLEREVEMKDSKLESISEQARYKSGILSYFFGERFIVDQAKYAQDAQGVNSNNAKMK